MSNNNLLLAGSTPLIDWKPLYEPADINLTRSPLYKPPVDPSSTTFVLFTILNVKLLASTLAVRLGASIVNTVLIARLPGLFSL